MAKSNVTKKGGASKAVAKKVVEISDAEKSGEELVIENFEAVSKLITTLGETIELLVQKTESMAYHIIALEEMMAEVVSANGVNLPRVNARIRNTISNGTDNNCDPAKAIDIAAAIASPIPKR